VVSNNILSPKFNFTYVEFVVIIILLKTCFEAGKLAGERRTNCTKKMAAVSFNHNA